jgi:hypothetical protein
MKKEKLGMMCPSNFEFHHTRIRGTQGKRLTQRHGDHGDRRVFDERSEAAAVLAWTEMNE